MSRPLLSLTEQKYVEKMKKAVNRVRSELNRECTGMPVKFTTSVGTSEEPQVFNVEGKVTQAKFDKDERVLLFIDFENPKTGSPEIAVRYIDELRW